MRHRRFRQCVTYKYGNNKKAKDICKAKKNAAIHFSQSLGSSISTIELGRMFYTSLGVLDPTFKWVRE